MIGLTSTTSAEARQEAFRNASNRLADESIVHIRRPKKQRVVSNFNCQHICVERQSLANGTFEPPGPRIYSSSCFLSFRDHVYN